ncbi:MAG: O-antigen ligase family protein [Pyrinomonadaceae bacterium]
MRSNINEFPYFRKLSFGVFLIFIATLAIQKPTFTIAGQNLTASDILFPIVAILTFSSGVLRKIRVRWFPIYWVFAAYIAAFSLSTVFSAELSRSVLKTLATAYLIGIAVITISYINSQSRLRVTILTFLVASSVPILIGLLTIILFYLWNESPIIPLLTYHYGAVPVGNYPRLSSIFVSASMFCNFLNVVLMFLLIAYSKRWVSKMAFGLGIAAVIVTSIFTISSGLGTLFLAFGLWYWYLNPLRSAGRFAVWAGTLVFAITFLLSFFALQPHSTAPYTIHLPFFATELYPSSRLLVWSESVRTFTENFWIGTGPGVASAAVSFQNSEGSYSLLTDAHNSFLSVATQTGIFGFIALVTLTVYLLRNGFRKVHGEPIKFGVAAAFLTAFVLQGMTGSFEDARHLWFLIGLLVAVNEITKTNSAAELGGRT